MLQPRPLLLHGTHAGCHKLKTFSKNVHLLRDGSLIVPAPIYDVTEVLMVARFAF
jgi:hypothetical protein